MRPRTMLFEYYNTTKQTLLMRQRMAAKRRAQARMARIAYYGSGSPRGLNSAPATETASPSEPTSTPSPTPADTVYWGFANSPGLTLDSVSSLYQNVSPYSLPTNSTTSAKPRISPTLSPRGRTSSRSRRLSTKLLSSLTQWSDSVMGPSDPSIPKLKINPVTTLEKIGLEKLKRRFIFGHCKGCTQGNQCRDLLSMWSRAGTPVQLQA